MATARTVALAAALAVAHVAHVSSAGYSHGSSSGALAPLPSCDALPSQEPDAVCQGFCSGACSFYNTTAGDSGRAETLAIYRVTPRQALGIEDKDTGDAPGDVGFSLSNRQHALGCLRNTSDHGCFLDNNTDNIYGRFEVEFDGQYGPYHQCNPLYQNASNPFQCWQKCETPPNCHNSSSPWDSWVNSTQGWQGTTCYCETCPRCNKTVGRAHNPYTWHGVMPDGWPKQCYRFDPVSESARPARLDAGTGTAGSFYRRAAQGGVHAEGATCLTGTVLSTVKGANLAATLELACNACSDANDADDDDKPLQCAGWTVVDNTTGTLFHKIHGVPTAPSDLTPSAASCVSGRFDGDHWGGSIGVAVGGLWYSTPSDGECAKGAALGTGGCTWRYTGEPSYVSAPCVDDHLDTAVEKHGAACFKGCAQPHNQTSLCYSECYVATIEGDPVHNIAPMTKATVVKPWESAFLPTDQGGCPRVKV